MPIQTATVQRPMDVEPAQERLFNGLRPEHVPSLLTVPG